MRRLALVLLVLAIAGLVVWFAVLRGEDKPRATVEPAIGSASASAPAGSSGTKPPARSPVRRLADPSKRQDMLEAIRKAAQKRMGTSATGGSTPQSATPPPTLPEGPDAKEYIRTSVRALIPLLVECYNEALERDPKLGGTMVVDFTIEGEPDVGGVIGDSAIADTESTIKDPTMRECIQQTMYAIEIDPPAAGGTVKVRYPFEFSNNP
jgi:hypothetical protein